MNNDSICEKSVFFEKMLEHRFISDIMMHGWYSLNKEVKILYPEIDSSGYDIVLDCENICRYVQLKTSQHSSKRSYQRTNTALLHKQNPCIIWILYSFNKDKNDLDLNYFFWGAEIGKRGPSIKDYARAKSKPNAKGKKKITSNMRNIPKGQFIELAPGELLNKLFVANSDS